METKIASKRTRRKLRSSHVSLGEWTQQYFWGGTEQHAMFVMWETSRHVPEMCICVAVGIAWCLCLKDVPGSLYPGFVRVHVCGVHGPGPRVCAGAYELLVHVAAMLTVPMLTRVVGNVVCRCYCTTLPRGSSSTFLYS
jgi:hypothetical protein